MKKKKKNVPARVFQHVSCDYVGYVTIVVSHSDKTSPCLIFICDRFYQGG